jgi:hypothetical protein
MKTQLQPPLSTAGFEDQFIERHPLWVHYISKKKNGEIPPTVFLSVNEILSRSFRCLINKVRFLEIILMG